MSLFFDLLRHGAESGRNAGNFQQRDLAFAHRGVVLIYRCGLFLFAPGKHQFSLADPDDIDISFKLIGLMGVESCSVT